MKKTIYFALLCMVMSLTCCDKINEATSKEIKVNGVSFKFTAVSNAPAATRSAGEVELRAATQTFSVTRTVLLSELGNPDVVEFANKIRNVTVSNTQITVTADNGVNYTVENLTVTAVGVAGSLAVPTFVMGGTVALPANTKSFTEAFVAQLYTTATHSVAVTVTGKTDAPAGTTLNVSYESDLVLTARIL